MKTEVPILTYHEIIDDDFRGRELLRKMKKGYFVKKSVFDEQMQYLKNEGLSCITLREFAEFLKNPIETILPERCFAITFDDGYLGNHKYALPILKKYDFTATFFVTVNFIGTPFMMGWNELMHLKEGGMSIQSHTLSHPFLKQMNDYEVRRELQESKKILEDKLKIQVDFFSLPHGSYGNNYKRIAIESSFLGGCSSKEGLNDKSTDIYLLKRINTSGDYRLLDFIRIINRDKSFIGFLTFREGLKNLVKNLLGEKLYDNLYNLIFNLVGKNE